MLGFARPRLIAALLKAGNQELASLHVTSSGYHRLSTLQRAQFSLNTGPCRALSSAPVSVGALLSLPQDSLDKHLEKAQPVLDKLSDWTTACRGETDEVKETVRRMM